MPQAAYDQHTAEGVMQSFPTTALQGDTPTDNPVLAQQAVKALAVALQQVSAELEAAQPKTSTLMPLAATPTTQTMQPNAIDLALCVRLTQKLLEATQRNELTETTMNQLHDALRESHQSHRTAPIEAALMGFEFEIAEQHLHALSAWLVQQDRHNERETT